jgi:metabotropic X receptor
MVISPPRAIHHYPTREDNLLVCSSYIDASYMIAFTYPIFLIVVCTVYAVLTRKIPEAFNESKHIGESDESLLCFCGSFGRGESLLVVFV